MRIGGGQGFYGDGHAGVGPLLDAGVDYLVCEALAELTLAILAKDRQRDEALGYTRDLPAYVAMALPWIVDGRTRFITNAGGINPVAASRAVVDGLRAAGADIVITGRVADASLFLAPLVHEFGWSWDDWDRLAAGVTIGHLLECSAQVTGGNYSGAWWEHGDFSEPGFPIAECAASGDAVITKPAGTGGVVSFDTVREQLLYEVHDPAAYLNPDVTADFTSVQLEDLGDDRVRVHDVRGAAAPVTYKGLVCTPAGYSGEARLAYPWPDAEAKARAGARFMVARARQLGIEVQEWREEYFGLDAFGGPTVPVDELYEDDREPSEVMARIVWRCQQKRDAATLTREMASSAWAARR